MSKEIGRRVAYIYQCNCATGGQVAKLLGISCKELIDKQKGKVEFTMPELEILAEKFQVPVSYFTQTFVKENELTSDLCKAMEKLTKNDHDEIIKFCEVLKERFSDDGKDTNPV